MKRPPPLCIYHSNCADGFGAACVVKYYYSELNNLSPVEFHPGVHQESPPNVEGREVILVDFSYKRPVILNMAKRAKSILIIDHHQSAAKDLVDLPENVTAIFDMNRSGAVLTWKHYFPDRIVPQLLLHIEDRDLWRFKLENTREISAALFSYEYDLSTWMNLIFSYDIYAKSIVKDGKALERKHFKDIKEFIAVAKTQMEIAGYTVPVLNAPYFWSSDAGHSMSKGHPFAACYWFTPEGVVFSLRSDKDGEDVSLIASSYGGGGHEHAAGFRIPINKFVRDFLPKDTDAEWNRLSKSFLRKG